MAALIMVLTCPKTHALAAAVTFNSSHGDWMVLQQAPAKAAVYGSVPAEGAKVEVTVKGGEQPYTVKATVTGLTWKALLQPTGSGGDYQITAACTCNEASNITFCNHSNILSRS